MEKWFDNEMLIDFLQNQLPKLFDLCQSMDLLPSKCNNDFEKVRERNLELLERDGCLNEVLKKSFEELAADDTLSDAEREDKRATLCSMTVVLKIASWEQIRLLMALQHSFVSKSCIYELIDFCNSITQAKQNLDNFKDGVKNGK